MLRKLWIELWEAEMMEEVESWTTNTEEAEEVVQRSLAEADMLE